MRKQIIFTPDEPNRNLLWLHRKDGVLVLEQYGPSGWEPVGTDNQEILDLLAKKADLIDGKVPMDQLPDNLVYTDIDGNIRLRAGAELQGTSGEKTPTIGKVDSYKKSIPITDIKEGMNLRGYVLKVDTTKTDVDPNIDGSLAIGDINSGGYGLHIFVNTLGLLKTINVTFLQGDSPSPKIWYNSATKKWSSSVEDIIIPNDRDYIAGLNTLTKSNEDGFGMDVFTVEESFASVSLGDQEFPLILNSKRRPIVATPEKEESMAYESDLESKADLVGGKVPASQLPSYVEDIIDFYDFITIDSAEQEKAVTLQFERGETIIAKSTVEPYKIKYNNKVLRLNENTSPEDWSIEEPALDKLYFKYIGGDIYRWSSGGNWINIGEDTNKKIKALENRVVPLYMGLISDPYDLSTINQGNLAGINSAISNRGLYNNIVYRLDYDAGKTLQLGVVNIDYPSKSISFLLPNGQIDTYQIGGTTGNLTFEKISSTGQVVTLKESELNKTYTEPDDIAGLTNASKLVIEFESAGIKEFLRGSVSGNVITFINSNSTSGALTITFNIDNNKLSGTNYSVNAPDALFYGKYGEAGGSLSKTDLYAWLATASKSDAVWLLESDLSKVVGDANIRSKLLTVTTVMLYNEDSGIAVPYYTNGYVGDPALRVWHSLTSKNEEGSLLYNIQTHRLQKTNNSLLPDALRYSEYSAKPLGTRTRDNLVDWLATVSTENVLYYTQDQLDTTLTDENEKTKVNLATTILVKRPDESLLVFNRGDYSANTYIKFICPISWGFFYYIDYRVDTGVLSAIKYAKVADTALFIEEYQSAGGLLSKQDLYKWLVYNTFSRVVPVEETELDQVITNVEMRNLLAEASKILLIKSDNGGILELNWDGNAPKKSFITHTGNSTVSYITYDTGTFALSALLESKMNPDGWSQEDYTAAGGELDETAVFKYFSDLTKLPIAVVPNSALGTTITDAGMKEALSKSGLLIVQESTGKVSVYSATSSTNSLVRLYYNVLDSDTVGYVRYEYNSGYLSAVSTDPMAEDSLRYSPLNQYGNTLDKADFYRWMAEHAKDGAVYITEDQINTALPASLVERLKTSSTVILQRDNRDHPYIGLRTTAADTYTWFIFNDPTSWLVVRLTTATSMLSLESRSAVVPSVYYTSVGGKETLDTFNANYATLFSNNTLVLNQSDLANPVSDAVAARLNSIGTIVLKMENGRLAIFSGIYHVSEDPVFYGWYNGTSFVRLSYNPTTKKLTSTTVAYPDVYYYYNSKGGSKPGSEFAPSFVASQEANWVQVNRSQIGTVVDNTLDAKLRSATTLVLIDDTTTGYVPQMLFRVSGTLDPDNSTGSLVWYGFEGTSSFTRLSYSTVEKKLGNIGSINISAKEPNTVSISESELNVEMSPSKLTEFKNASKVIYTSNSGARTIFLRDYYSSWTGTNSDATVVFRAWENSATDHDSRLIYLQSNKPMARTVTGYTPYDYYTKAGGGKSSDEFKENFVANIENNTFTISQSWVGGSAIDASWHEDLKKASTVILLDSDSKPHLFLPSEENDWSTSGQVYFYAPINKQRFRILRYHVSTRKFVSLEVVGIEDNRTNTIPWASLGTTVSTAVGTALQSSVILIIEGSALPPYSNMVFNRTTTDNNTITFSAFAVVNGTITVYTITYNYLTRVLSNITTSTPGGGELKVVDLDSSDINSGQISSDKIALVRGADILRVHNINAAGIDNYYLLFATREAAPGSAAGTDTYKYFQGFNPDLGRVSQSVIWIDGKVTNSSIWVDNDRIDPGEPLSLESVLVLDESYLGDSIDSERSAYMQMGWPVKIAMTDNVIKTFQFGYQEGTNIYYYRISGNSTMERLTLDMMASTLSTIETISFSSASL